MKAAQTLMPQNYQEASFSFTSKTYVIELCGPRPQEPSPQPLVKRVQFFPLWFSLIVSKIQAEKSPSSLILKHFLKTILAFGRCFLTFCLCVSPWLLLPLGRVCRLLFSAVLIKALCSAERNGQHCHPPSRSLSCGCAVQALAPHSFMPGRQPLKSPKFLSFAVKSVKNCLIVNDRKAAQTGLREKGKDGGGLSDPGLAHGMGSCRN